MPILSNKNQVSVLVDGLDHPEGIAWGLDGYAYAGGEAGQLYRIDVERGEARQFAQVAGGFILATSTPVIPAIAACSAYPRAAS